MRYKYFSVICVVSLVFLVAESSCTKKGNIPVSNGDTLVIHYPGTPSLINPILTTSTIAAPLTEIIFDGLIKLDEFLEPKPQLAKSWTSSKDGLRWIFYLRKGVRFHDGTELTAEDVKFTLDQARNPRIKGLFSNSFRDIKEVIVKDLYTVELIFEKPFAALLDYLDVGILPKHLFINSDIEENEWNYKPVGTGPFKFTKWSEDEVVLEANHDYFLGRPHLDKLIIKIVSNKKVAWASLLSEQSDLMPALDNEDYGRLEGVPFMKIYSYKKPFYYMIAFNNSHPLFRETVVRQALNYVVDKEKLIEKILMGKGDVSAGTVYPESWAYNESVKPYPFNAQKALRLLTEAGWRDTDGDHVLDREGQRFEFTINTNAADDLKTDVIMILQDQFSDIGIQIKTKFLDPSEPNAILNKKSDSYFSEFVSRGDPDFSYRYIHSSQISEGLNFFFYKNEKIDRLLDEGRKTMDLDKRKAIYFEFQEELLRDPPGIFLFWTDQLIGIHKRFRGVKFSPAGVFNNIHEWYVPKEEQKYN